jgi:hypothetical protein
MVLTLINGHQLTHFFEMDEQDHEDSTCLVCEFQIDQQEDAFLIPGPLKIEEPLRIPQDQTMTVFVRANKKFSFPLELTSRPPPSV